MISRDDLLALAGKRFEAVGGGNIDTVMAGLVDEPVYDLYPMGLRLSGHDNVRRHYEYYFQHVVPQMVGFESHATLFGDDSVGVELTISWQPEGGSVQSGRIFVVQPVEGDKFTGERAYGDEALLRWMFAGAALEPISA